MGAEAPAAAPVEYIPRIRDNYQRLGYKPYQWVVNTEPPPWAPLRKPLSGCRLGLAASGGIYVSGQVAFHYKDDTSIRDIPADVDVGELRATHFAYDLTSARRDPNVVFPIEALRRLAREGVVGGLAATFHTFMGGIYSARRVAQELAPRLTERFLQDRVDAVLLVPV
ncbi:MAG: glycine/sarcosine/betaine reductase selenoprotein B family protein [Verrucomicrobiota bacterium]